ncbi:unnamed protein product [Urochloa humidicola]
MSARKGGSIDCNVKILFFRYCVVVSGGGQDAMDVTMNYTAGKFEASFFGKVIFQIIQSRITALSCFL